MEILRRWISHRTCCLLFSVVMRSDWGSKVGAILIETGLFPNVNPYVERFQEIWVRMGLLRSARYLRLVLRKIVQVPIVQPEAVSSHLSC
ncbi:hypothetical protein V3C99_002927 [Haemonchus contortus]|uniref:DUF772 domain-containing protein n=1 Tax=Haemonchus contortus TaxID=6289 RepID=A0A7I4Y8G1_HAECO